MALTWRSEEDENLPDGEEREVKSKVPRVRGKTEEYKDREKGEPGWSVESNRGLCQIKFERQGGSQLHRVSQALLRDFVSIQN